MAELLTRDDFREGCLKRDRHSCVICGSVENLSVHHIVERRLFENGGYFLDNGATLCEPHHIEAEKTDLSCEEIREAAGIKKVILPETYYSDHQYTKWGDIILPNGSRMKGPLFYDESVQKILKSGSSLYLYTDYVKYPRSIHLPWSQGQTKDDKTLSNCKHFEGKRVIVTEKMDGENCLDGDTILFVNGENLTIREICESKITGEIFGFDNNTWEIVKASIEGFHIGEEAEEWLLIELEDGSFIQLTPEHKVFLPALNCYRDARDLKIGDDLLKK